MRKSLPVLFIFVIAVAAYASQLSIQRVLSQAVNGERAAAARYDAFAERAQSDGYPGVANLFRAQAKAERIHLRRFSELMKERGMPLPPEEPVRLDVSATDRNLQTAIMLEQAERDSTYLYAINTCNDAREEKVAKVFDVTRDSETEHANLCANALRNMKSMQNAKAFYVCPICGYTTDVSLMACPACMHRGSLDEIN